MFVCNCNGLSEQQVDEAIEQGCAKPLDIYSHCGTEPKCGKCMERMWDRLQSFSAYPVPAL